jgi:hypothetical protein
MKSTRPSINMHDRRNTLPPFRLDVAGEVGMFAAIALSSRQAFELRCSAQLIVLKDRGDCVIISGMHAENQLGHTGLANRNRG